VAAACGDTTGSGSAFVLVAPLLDSLYVGDTVAAGGYTATFFNASGNPQTGGTTRWSSSAPAIVAVDSITGRAIALQPGLAVIQATVNGFPGQALIVVTKTHDLTLLLDTIYLMPGDTFTVPVELRHKGGSPPPVRFAVSPNAAVYTIDSVTGRITAQGEGLPTRLVARSDTVADTGAVEVVVLTDTVGGKSFLSVFGTVTHRRNAGARALNYARQGGSQHFRISTSVVQSGFVIENAVVTLLNPVTNEGTFSFDSLSPNEAFNSSNDAVCRPARGWGIWSTRTSLVELTALSRSGTISITQITPVAHGSAISGRFQFDAQRTDFYDDALGILPVRGTFVAPLITDLNTCGN
jgi:hypothetical protein